MDDEPCLQANQQALSQLCTIARKQHAESEMSTFFSLPAEIRIIIYEMLFLHNDPIRFDRPSAPFRSHTCLSIPGLSFLATCRQVRGEAVGILYGQNTYLVPSRVIYMFIHWLECIGASSKHVRRLMVEVKPNPYYVGIVELLHILQYCISPNGTSLQVSFVGAVSPSQPGTAIFNQGQTFDPERMARTFISLRSRTSSELAFYLRLTRTLYSVTLSTDAKKLEFSIRPHCLASRAATTHVSFNISDTGVAVRTAAKPHNLSLEGILSQTNVFRRLSNFVAPSPWAIQFDLEHRTMSDVPFEILGLNRSLRNAVCAFLSQRDIKVSMTTRTNESSFGKFESLESFFANSPLKDFRGFRRLSPSMITLQYKLGPDSTQKDIRLRALDLMKATSSLTVWTDISIKIFTSDTKQVTSDGKVGLLILRQRIFCFLIDLLKSQPDLVHLPAPYIWIDQNGTPREASLQSGCSNPAIYLNDRLELNSDGMKLELESSYQWLKKAKQNASGPQGAKDGKTLLDWAEELEYMVREKYGFTDTF